MSAPSALLAFPGGRRFDLACLGRLAVDLYAQQFGARLEDVTSFAKYLGGSSANIAFGAARLGLRAAMISRVGDEQMGRFLVETLQRELARLDYYEGSFTGTMNNQTVVAITYLQRDAGLAQTGTMNAATQQALATMLAQGNNQMGS